MDYQKLIDEAKANYPDIASRVIFRALRETRPDNSELRVGYELNEVRDTLRRIHHVNAPLTMAAFRELQKGVLGGGPFVLNLGISERTRKPIYVLYVQSSDQNNVMSLPQGLGLMPASVPYSVAQDNCFKSMIFDHEFAHILTFEDPKNRLQNKLPMLKNATHYMELVSDLYTTLRAIQRHGESGLETAKLWADTRVIRSLIQGDVDHDTSAALDHVIGRIEIAGIQFLQDMTLDEVYDMAADYALQFTMDRKTTIERQQTLKAMGSLPLNIALWKRIRIASQVDIYNGFQDRLRKAFARLTTYNKGDNLELYIAENMTLPNAGLIIPGSEDILKGLVQSFVKMKTPVTVNDDFGRDPSRKQYVLKIGGRIIILGDADMDSPDYLGGFASPSLLPGQRPATKDEFISLSERYAPGFHGFLEAFYNQFGSFEDFQLFVGNDNGENTLIEQYIDFIRQTAIANLKPDADNPAYNDQYRR